MKELQRRFLELALDAALDTANASDSQQFRWTAETLDPVWDWWQAATPQRRDQLLQMIRAGQIDIAALPFNASPYMDSQQWDKATHWVPEEIWKRLQPRVAMQNDVNGFPRAAAIRLLDRGIRYSWMGINDVSGGAPFRRPMGFWWKMPDGRKLLVWLGGPYWEGYDFFSSQQWRYKGYQPLAADPLYHTPRPGEILAADEASVRQAHEYCLSKLHKLEQSGYAYNSLAISMTNQWRIDNDPPYPALADFVATWQHLGLKPELHLTTASAAMQRMEKEIGNSFAVYEGEWTDWWANGTLAAPRELAASRRANRLLRAAEVPLWGEWNERWEKVSDEIRRSLCLFSEHTGGMNICITCPFHLNSLAHFNEKFSLAYRPMVQAEWLLSQRVRILLSNEPEGLYIANTSAVPYCGWIRIPANSLRGSHPLAVVDSKSEDVYPLVESEGWSLTNMTQEKSPTAKLSEGLLEVCPQSEFQFWINHLAPQTIRRFQFSNNSSPDSAAPPLPAPAIQINDLGWPISVRWPEMKSSLFAAGFGDFLSVHVKGDPEKARMILLDIGDTKLEKEREHKRETQLEEIWATSASQAFRHETPYTVLFVQKLQHPRLKGLIRQLELWKQEPHARLTVRLDRLSSMSPERFFVTFPLPTEETLPRLSNGGEPFVPYRDQLPGTNCDFFAMDGWVQYATSFGHWLWSSQDAAAVTFGGSQMLSRRSTPPKRPGMLLAVIYDNCWYTNFLGDSPGLMEFHFDLAWKRDSINSDEVKNWAEGVQAEPVLMLNPGIREDPRVLKDLFQP